MIGVTALTVGFSASKKNAHKSAHSKKPTTTQHTEASVDRDTSPTYKTLAESLGSPAPVLKADGRSPQSEAPPAKKPSELKVGESVSASPVLLAPSDELKTSQSVSSTLSAQSNATASNLGVVDGRGGRTYGFIAATTMNSSVLERGANTASSSMDLEFVPWVSLSKKIRMDLFLGLSKDLRNEERTTFQNSTLAIFNTPISFTPVFKYRAKLGALLPTNEESREIHSFRGGINLSNRFFILPTSLPELSMFYQINVAKNFHRFQTTGLGESNQSYSIAHAYFANYEIGNFYFSVTPRFTQRWTYQGTPSTLFSNTEEVGMNVRADFSLALGHTNADNLFQANGRDSNFSVFDQDTSNYYISANYIF